MLKDSKLEGNSIMTSSSQQRKYTLTFVAILVLVIIWSLRLLLPTMSGFPMRLGIGGNSSVSTPHDSEFNAITKNVAVIIDDRPLDKLVPLILHFSSVLGPNWPVILFTSQSASPMSAPFRRAINERRLSVRFLPPNIQFTSQLSVSEFLTSSWLWEQLAPAEHVLLFQADSILCSTSALRVEDFLQYDFVGAPIDPSLGYGSGFNGGLSLRNRSMILDIVSISDWRSEFDHAENKNEPSVQFEDQWFYKKMKELPAYENGGPGARLPPIDVAMTFSVETMWYDTPLGYHQIERWQKDRLDEVDKWCPERRIASTDLLVTKGNS
jgi:hypothetical protein